MPSRKQLIKRRTGPPSKIPDDILRQMFTKMALWQTDEEIHKWLVDECKVSISLKGVKYYRYNEKYQHFIDRDREKFESEIFKLEFASKRRRVEELSDMYLKLKSSRKFRDAARMLEQIRIEREGREREIGDIFQFNQYNAIPDEVLKDKLEINRKLIEEIKNRKELTNASEK